MIYYTISIGLSKNKKHVAKVELFNDGISFDKMFSPEFDDLADLEKSINDVKKEIEKVFNGMFEKVEMH